MPTLKRHDGVVHYEVNGTGEPIVILRGLARTVKHWMGYDTMLAEHFRVVTMDLRGVGKSTQPHRWGTTLFDLADDVAAVLTAAGIEKAHILGVSLGGMVALATGLGHPERCKSVITVNTSIAGQKTLRMSVPGALGLLEGGVRGDGRIHTNLAGMMVGPDCPAEERARIAREFAAIAESEGMNTPTAVRQLLAAARFRVRDRLKELGVPTLVIYGTDDKFVPNVNSRKIAALVPNARLVPIEGGGHELTLDKGPELTKVLMDWVARE